RNPMVAANKIGISREKNFIPHAKRRRCTLAAKLTFTQANVLTYRQRVRVRWEALKPKQQRRPPQVGIEVRRVAEATWRTPFPAMKDVSHCKSSIIYLSTDMISFRNLFVSMLH